MRKERMQKPAGQQDNEVSTAKDADLRDDQLDEDVDCCLAGIDDLLEEQEKQQETACREFRLIKRRWDTADNQDPAWNELFRETEDELRIWQAKYAHLGLGYH